MNLPLILSAISLCLCAFGFFFFRRYIERKTAATELLADYRTEVNRLIAGIDAATDRDSLLVEERIKTLKAILDDTDRRISVYMRELQRSRNGEAMYASLGRGIRAALDSRPLSQEAPLPVEAHPPAGAVQELFPLDGQFLPVTAQEIAPYTEAPPQQEVQTADNNSSDQREPNVRRKNKHSKPVPKKAKLRTQIAEMSAQGLAPAEIASRLKLTLAEVDLALNLLTR
ncbi:MAG: hypothetical protein FWC24_02520 [Treponema sp.]|nr:hypothetical protein [Treponema sp.]